MTSRIFVDSLGNRIADITDGTFNVGTIAADTISAPTITATGGLRTTKNAAPADASVAAGELVIWLDKTNGAGKLMIKAKTTDGTVATGSVNLT